MRRIIGGVFQSLDGVMQAPGVPDRRPDRRLRARRLDVPRRRRASRRSDRRLLLAAIRTAARARTYDIVAAF